MSEQTGDGTPAPGAGGVESPPVLIRVEGTDGPARPGDVITLVGLNFATDIDNNEVFFTAGNQRVRGLPLNTRSEPTDDGANVQSLLDVVVPGGVSRGQVELVVNGQSAGAAGIDIQPLISGFTLGINEDQSVLRYTPRLGFEQGASRVTVYGTSFSDVQEAVVSDDFGNSRRIPANTFVRNPGQTTGPNVQPTGLDSIAFNLRDDTNDIRLPFQGARGNLGIELRGPRHESNRIEVPVTTDPAPDPDNEEIGFVVSNLDVPLGVVTGPVKLTYTAYELGVDAEWRMEVDFRVSNTQFQSPWTPAKPTENDPENNGIVGITAGSPEHASGERLLPGIGMQKTFVWDALNDPEFRRFNEEQGENGLSRPRYWKVEFRLRPVPDTDNRTFIEHDVVSAPVLYYDLADRPGDSVAEQRSSRFIEDFSDNALEDTRILSRRQALQPGIDIDESVLEDPRALAALWGPPLNPGLLQGSVEDREFTQFGTGTAVMVLEPVPETFLDPDETILDEFIEFDTDRMEIVHHVISDNGTPDDDGDDVDAAFLEPLEDADGNPVENPGIDIHEFHLASLTFKGGVETESRGAFPLVVRLSGLGVEEDGPLLVVEEEATFSADGERGGDGSPIMCPVPPNCGDRNGEGGAPGAGGGRGGDGGQVTIFPGFLRVRQQLDAQDGSNQGGTFGGTPAAVHFAPDQPNSFFHGAPGGGGGHRTRGGDGDYGRKAIAQYEQPKTGLGGPPRGEWTQFPLTTGSGGGGGGASLSKAQGADLGPYFTAAGAGGGGGGGAIRVVAAGSIRVDGMITANGGNGADGLNPHHHSLFAPDYPHRPQIAPGGAGGGGSGGSILLQALEEIEIANCENLQVEGGEGGSAQRAGNQEGGMGAPGFIRLESSEGGLPFCGEVSVVEVEGDVAEPQTAGLVETDDDVDLGRGQDGVLQLSFIPSLDPVTNTPIIDPDTGEPVSIWRYDTGTGVFTRPDGETFTSRLAGTVDVSRLFIDEGVTLRVSGPNPFRLRVREHGEIAGTIDCSGFSGGALRFSAPGERPLPGLGGDGGPGGGRGGDGGTIEHVDNDPTHRAPENTIVIDGQAGGAPPGTEAFVANDRFPDGADADQLVPPEFLVAVGGAGRPGRRGPDCDTACIDGGSAGGGGGGGNQDAGEDGQVRLFAPDPELEAELIGRGGSVFGFDTLRFDGELFLFGGTGGAGGGPSADVSSAYQQQAQDGPGRAPVLGDYPFPGQARFAPGTGGGGGGGVLHLVANTLRLRPTARLLARGGDAPQSIDLGGNGGGGAGGTVILQIARSLSFEPGARVDVRGGRPNRLPPRTLEGLRAYEGNVREQFIGSAPGVPEDEGSQAFGGLGGPGAPGRVRIETPAGSGLSAPGLNSSLSGGVFLTDVVESVAVSRPVRLGLGPGFTAGSFRLKLGAPRVDRSPLVPPGTQFVVLWEGAPESLDVHGAVGEFSGLVRDPRRLDDTEFVRFKAYFRSNLLTRNSQAVRSIQLPYRLEVSEDPDDSAP